MRIIRAFAPVVFAVLAAGCTVQPAFPVAAIRIPPPAAGKAAVIPPRRHRRQQRDYDRHLYKARHLVENFFAKLKQFRGIATRYDKTARNFLAAIHLAAAYVWLI